MATLDDALKLVKRDPPAAFVGLAVTAAQPPAAAIVVPLKGRQLLLPDWSGVEWKWYCDLAVAIAKSQEVKNSAGAADVARALAELAPLATTAATLGASHPTTDQAGAIYTAAVKLVIASNAAATGSTAGELATQAFKTALVEAPQVILDSLKAGLEKGLSNMTKVQREAARILGEIFIEPIKAIGGGLLAGLGPFGIALLAGAAWFLWGKKGGHE